MTPTRMDSNTLICSEALSKGYGLLKDLESELSEKEVRDLELLGYIENAMTSNGETWRLTAKGRELRKLMTKKPTMADSVKDWIFVHLLKFNVNL